MNKNNIKTFFAIFMCLGSFGCVPSWLVEKEYDTPDDLIPAGGEVKWSYAIPKLSSEENLNSEYPMRAEAFFTGIDGTIYVYPFGATSPNSELQAIGADGTAKWNFEFIGYYASDHSIITSGGTSIVYIPTQPTVGPDGTVYLLSEDHNSTSISAKLYALNPDGTQKWMLEKTNIMFIYPSSIVIDNKGTIYLLLIDRNSLAMNLLAVNPDGTERWSIPFSKNIIDESISDLRYIIGRDGYLYISFDPTVDDFTIYNDNAYHVNRTIRMVNPSDGSIIRTFREIDLDIVGADGMLYAKGRQLLAYNADETLAWSFGNEKDETVKSLQLKSSDNTLYAIFSHTQETSFWDLFKPDMYLMGTDYSRLYALNTDGKLQWSLPMGVNADTSLIGPDGTIYVLTNGGKLYAINPDGSWKWRFDSEETFSTVTAGAEGTIYLVSDSGTLYAVEDTGAAE